MSRRPEPRSAGPATDGRDGRADPAGREDAIRRDDRLLDTFGCAENGFGSAGSGAPSAVPSEDRYDDPALQLLAAWREDLTADPLPAIRPPGPERAAPAAPEEPATQTCVGRRTPVRSRRRRRRGRRLVLFSALAVFATTGVTGVAVAAAGAEPDSPLWPITTIMYPEQAAARQHRLAAARDLANARRAAAAGRTKAARRYLADADRHSRQVSGSAAERLRRNADRLRNSLDGRDSSAGEGSAGTPDPAASPSDRAPSATVPATGGPVEQPSPSTTPTGSSPEPEPSGAGATAPDGGAGVPTGTGHSDGNGPGHGKGHGKKRASPDGDDPSDPAG